jgi:hypothetical protein
VKIDTIAAYVFAMCLAGLLSTATRAADSPAADALAGSGPYPAVMVTDSTLPGFTVYRPKDLKKLGSVRMPLVAWGNGGCSDVGDSAKAFLSEIASHGYLVIAVGPPKPLNAEGAAEKPVAGAPPRVGTHSSQLLDALSWAAGQATRSGGDYAGHLDPTKTAVMGQSCGGLQALEVSADPRIGTSVILDSGVLKDPPPFPMPGVVTNDKGELAKLHAPLIYLIGGPKDIAHDNAADDFAHINQVPVFMANIDVGHGGTFAQPNGGAFAQVATAWLQWQLKGDAAAAKMFVGANCGLCTDTAWTVQAKNIH